MKSTTYVEFSHPPSLSGLAGVPQNKGTPASSTSKTSMPPPTYTHAPLRKKLESLKQSTLHNTQTQRTSHQDRLRIQIKAWSESMTPEQRTRHFTTVEVERLAGLVGKHGGRAAHHHVAMALWAVGFKHCRDWTVAGRNRRYWKFHGV